jgi:hypothetical protein
VIADGLVMLAQARPYLAIGHPCGGKPLYFNDYGVRHCIGITSRHKSITSFHMNRLTLIAAFVHTFEKRLYKQNPIIIYMETAMPLGLRIQGLSSFWL